jgi:predicted kinase
LARQAGLRDLPLVSLGVLPGRLMGSADILTLAYLGVALPPIPGSLQALKAGALRLDLAEAKNLSERDAATLALGLAELANRRPMALTDTQSPARIPRLILAAGLTAAGKSTFARALCARVPGLIHLDVDAIRRSLSADTPTYKAQEAWATHNSTRSLAEWALRACRSVIIDATGLTAADRAHYLASAPLFGARSILVWLETDEPEAAARLTKRAAGGDPTDHSSADAEFRHRSLARLERPRLAEADTLLPATPGNLETVMGILVGALGDQS